MKKGILSGTEEGSGGLGEEDGKFSLKMKAELSSGKKSISTWLPLVLRPRDSHHFPSPSLNLLSFSSSPLSPMFPSVFCINFPAFSSLIHELIGKILSTPNFYLMFLEVRSKIFQCPQVVRECISFHSTIAAKEGKKT